MRSKLRLGSLKRANQAKLRLTTQRRGRSIKPFFASGSLTTSSSMPCLVAALLACSPVYLVSPSPIDRLVSGLLGLLAQRIKLATLLLVGWRNAQGQQITRCIYSHMRLGVVAHRSRRAARSLVAAWQDPGIEHHRAGLAPAALAETDDRMHVLDQGLKASGIIAALSLLIGRRPRQKIMGPPSARASFRQSGQGRDNVQFRVLTSLG